MQLDDARDAVVEEVDGNSVNFGITVPLAPPAVDRIAEAVEFATPKGPARSFFAKAKAVRGPALARAYPLHLLLKGDPEGADRVLALHKFSHRKRRPNKSNTALIAVIIALNPANEDDYAACSEEAYALQALADRGVPAEDFERDYFATTIVACKKAVRMAKRKADPTDGINKETPSTATPSSGEPCAKPYFAVILVSPEGIQTLCRADAPDIFGTTPFAQVDDSVHLTAYRNFLREAQRLTSPSRSLIEPDDPAMPDTS